MPRCSRVTKAAVSCLLAVTALSSLAVAGEFPLRGYTLLVPEGYTVELVAEEPLVTYPICADFDEQGRLYVAEASGAKDWNKPQPEESRHRILRLEDSDGDGRFDRRTVFAELEIIGQGSMWLDGSLYVAAAPVIWKLTDEDGDGVAERKEKWIEAQAVTGCLNDVRGPYLGPDGWIYWCKGAGAEHTFPVDGKPWTTTARHIFRRHPRGGDVEQLMIGGMANLIETAFARDGERFVTTTYIHLPGEPRKDGILHAIYGGIYPLDTAPIYNFPWTGPDMMPAMVGWDATSPCGLTRYESTGLGEDFRDNLFCCQFSGHKVVRHKLEPSGATFAPKSEDFLACDDVQFHPTDVLEDADGSLLVIETGGWYLHCCPSSTFYRPDKHGAIYRIRRKDAARIDDPRGAALDWKNATPQQLAKRLEDPRLVVRKRAVEQLGRLGKAAVPTIERVLAESASADARCLAVWAATRIDGNEARKVVRLAIDDRDPVVCRAALNSISLHRDAAAAPKLIDALARPEPPTRRVAAEALGRIGDRDAVPSLLAALAKPTDRTLQHSLTLALIEIADPQATRAGLGSKNAAVRRSAMIALDQMPGGALDPALVVAELDSADAATQDAAWWLVSRHPRDWGAQIAAALRSRVDDEKLTAADRRRLVARLAQVARAPELSKWIVDELTRSGASSETQMLLLEAMGDAGGAEADAAWVEALLGLLADSGDKRLSAQVVSTLNQLPPLRTRDDAARKLRQALDARLRTTAGNAQLDEETRIAALSAIGAGRIEKIDDALLAFLLAKISPDQPLSMRAAAADVLSRSKLTEPQLLMLAATAKNLAASELNLVLEAFAESKSEAVGRRLVGALLASSAATSLNAFRLRGRLASFGPAVHSDAEPLFKRLEAAQAEQLAKAQRIIALVPEADPQRGLDVFHSNKAACTACHKAANVGGSIGPSLRGIAGRRTERDFVESILFPSASLVQSYESWNVVTDDGRTTSGVIQRDTPDELVITAGPDKTARIPRAAIEAMSRSDTSIMPQGIDKNLSEQQLADLVAYLKSLK